LGSVLYHGRSKWSFFPEFLVLAHEETNLLFLSILFAYIVLEEVVKRDIDVPIVVVLEKVRNKAVSDLGIEYEVRNKVELSNEYRSILAKIVEQLHDFIRLHYFSESVVEWIDCSHIY
jgi:hypothetical protein